MLYSRRRSRASSSPASYACQRRTASKPPRPVVSSLRGIPTCDSIALRPPTNPSRLSGCTRSRWIWSRAIRGNAFRRNGTSKREPLKVTRSFARSIAAGRSSRLSPWTKRRSFVQGDNLDDLPAAMERAKLLVTFNGSRFDVPFLRKAFPRMALDQIHLDLVHPLRRLGFVGGLKAIESQVGILRSEETTGLGGFDAVRLWHAYDAGDDDALDLLLEYNMEDVVNLEPLAELAYAGLRSLCLDGGFVTADRLPNRTGQPTREVQKKSKQSGANRDRGAERRATASTNPTQSGPASLCA